MSSLPTHQRPRERLLHLGVGSLTDAELLAVLLGTGSPGHSALRLAEDLLAVHDGPSGLSRLIPDELVRQPGVGLSKAARITAAFGLAARLAPAAHGRRLDGPQDIAAVVGPALASARRERVAVVVCDAGHRVRRVIVLTEGAADECLAPVREILTAVLLADGAAFALAHNHPSGDVTPSAEDHEVTASLAAAAHAVHLEFLDHVVVSGGRWASLDRAARGSAGP
jgi:DNA repair protein RadC